jgi:integrase
MTGSLQVKNNKYYAVLNFRDADKKRVQKWINLNLPEKGNKRKAEAKLNELIQQYQGYEDIGPTNMLFSKHVASWIETNKPHVVRTTYDQYVNMLNNHIAPYFDAKRITLSKLTPGDLEDYYSAKIQSGLSPNTVIKHHAVIRSALQWAVKHRYIRENVADLADRPTKVKYHGPAPYSIEEVAQLLNLTQNDPIAVPIFLASFYGLRRSELLGLRWSAIDFDTGTITISTTVVKESHGANTLVVVRDNMTKTETSMRTLPLCQYTYHYFHTLKQQQMRNHEIMGYDYDTRYLDFVCVDYRGTLIQPDYVTQKFQKLLNQYGLRRIRFHDLRHSCATIMLYLGYTMKDIQTWLGHSNYNFTADTYVHSSPQSHVEMADTLSQKLNDLAPIYLPE